MKGFITRLPLAALVAVIAVGGLVAFGAGKRAYQANGAYILPASQVISWDDTIGLLDTRTGAIYQFRGDVNNASVRNTWEIRVPAVTGETSGMLEIQRTTFNDPGTIFLVDIITGKTWILRRRASTNGTWDPVPIFRR